MNIVTLSTEQYITLLAEIRRASDAISELEELKKLFENVYDPKNCLRWISLQRLSEILEVSKRQIQNWRNTGELSYSKIGGKVYFNLDDVESFLQSHYSKYE